MEVDRAVREVPASKRFEVGLRELEAIDCLATSGKLHQVERIKAGVQAEYREVERRSKLQVLMLLKPFLGGACARHCWPEARQGGRRLHSRMAAGECLSIL
jgi:hypothetical protein